MYKAEKAKQAYHRGKGELPIHVSVQEATPVDTKGSSQYYLMGLPDKLTPAFTHISPDVIKSAAERRNLLKGVFISNFKPGGVLPTDFEQDTAVDGLWKAYKTGELTAMLQEVLVRPEVMKALGAKTLKFKFTINEEDYQNCKTEVATGEFENLCLDDRDVDLDMLHKVKGYQRELTGKVLKLRDDLTRFDQNMGELIMNMKRNLPDSVQEINTYSEYDELQKQIRLDRKISAKPFDYYAQVRQNCLNLLEEMREKICYPLSLVHASCETSQQQKQKQQINDKSKDMIRRLTPDANFSKLKHSGVQGKILLLEQALFLGLVSVIHFGVETVVDVDQHLDEYLSAVDLY